MRLIFIIFLAFSFLSQSQNNYPQDYFVNPLDIDPVLSGTFGELRSSHFHSGIDIKTQGRQGLKVKSVAKGYISRIKISCYGYGKALYITHPNGYTSVYAHLQKFSPRIESFIKKEQYKRESYTLELFPKADEFIIEQNEIIAYSGNTGGSQGPHLHFEIRDNAQRPINPMLFGIDVKDTSYPVVKAIYAYPLDDNSFINKSNSKEKLELKLIKNGEYVVKNIDAIGNIGFGIVTIDRQDLAPNQNGVYNIKSYVNGTSNFELDFKKFAFSETKHINGLIDYEHYTKKRERIQKLYNKDIPLSIIKPILNNGIITIEDNNSIVYKIEVTDFKQNTSTITINIKGTNEASSIAPEKNKTPYLVSVNEPLNLEKGSYSVNFYKDTFYENFYMDFNVSNDTLILHDDSVFAKKKFNISFDASKYSISDRNKLYIARLIGKKQYPVYSTTKIKGNNLVTTTNKLGTYTIARDITPPSIKPKNFKDKQWLSKYRYLKIKIDDTESGIDNYYVTVNGKWILMEYDYKTKTLTHDFNDGIVTDTKNNLKVIVTDNVGNNSTFEALFYRKL